MDRNSSFFLMKRLLYVVNFWVKKKRRSDIIFVGFSSMNILVEFFNFFCFRVIKN